MAYKGIDFKSALAMVQIAAGEAQIAPPKANGFSEDQRKDWLRRLWFCTRLLDGFDIASRYLVARGIIMSSWPLSLRWAAKLPHIDERGIRTLHPALVAKFSAPDGASATLHRTWIEEPGAKADVVPVRKMFPGKFPIGGAVRLAPAADTMGVAEGIETALSAMVIFGIPVWAATGANIMTAWKPPSQARHVIIFGDRDENFAGEYAAYGLAFRLSKNLHVEVRFPEIDGFGDFNDMVRRKK